MAPTVDPQLAVAHRHLDRLRVELDRCDAAIARYTGAGQHRIVTALLFVRETVDELETRLDAEAAEL